MNPQLAPPRTSPSLRAFVSASEAASASAFLSPGRAPAPRRPWVAQARIETPLGPLTAVSTACGLGGLWFDGQSHHPGALQAPLRESDPFIDAARRELAAYWKDGQVVFAVPLDPQGTAFQMGVWRMLGRIPAGKLESYGALAAQLGRPRAARAVGAAVGRNPLSIIVPCHRVVGSSGALTGYAGGLERKTALLKLEGASTQTKLVFG